MFDSLPFVGDLLDFGGKLYEGSKNRSHDKEMWERNAALQKEFAQTGIRWKVDDAKAAGIHPLYALGAQTHSFQPIASFQDNVLDGGEFGRMGQNLARAAAAGRTKDERYGSELEALALERAQLENELLRVRIAVTRSPQVGPAVPDIPVSKSALGSIPGQGDLVEVERSKIPTVTPGQPHVQAGPVPDNMWQRTERGFTMLPSKESAISGMEIENPSTWEWMFRNRLAPASGYGGTAPPDSFLPEGAIGWQYLRFSSEWVPVFSKDQSLWDRWRAGTYVRRGQRR